MLGSSSARKNNPVRWKYVLPENANNSIPLSWQIQQITETKRAYALNLRKRGRHEIGRQEEEEVEEEEAAAAKRIGILGQGWVDERDAEDVDDIERGPIERSP